MTTMTIMLNLAMAVPAVLVLMATVLVLRSFPGATDEGGPRGLARPFRASSSLPLVLGLTHGRIDRHGDEQQR